LRNRYVSQEHKLEILFVGYVLEQIQKKRPTTGKITTIGNEIHTVKLEGNSKTLSLFLETLQEWIIASPHQLPPIILNKHCPYCQFQSLCRNQAEQEDNLSLLDGISTLKLIRRYERKGIFTAHHSRNQMLKSRIIVDFVPHIVPKSNQNCRFATCRPDERRSPQQMWGTGPISALFLTCKWGKEFTF
jgi:hypothetical protein